MNVKREAVLWSSGDAVKRPRSWKETYYCQKRSSPLVIRRRCHQTQREREREREETANSSAEPSTTESRREKATTESSREAEAEAELEALPGDMARSNKLEF
jgi:hypothetical protein